MRLIDADLLIRELEIIYRRHGDKTTGALIEDLKNFPTVEPQPEEQCDNCHYKHIWMTQRMNGNGYFGHGGATG